MKRIFNYKIVLSLCFILMMVLIPGWKAQASSYPNDFINMSDVKNAPKLTVGKKIKVTAKTYQDVTWYAFTAPSTDRYVFSIYANVSTSVYVFEADDSNKYLYSKSAYSSKDCNRSSSIYMDTEAGVTYLIGVGVDDETYKKDVYISAEKAKKLVSVENVVLNPILFHYDSVGRMYDYYYFGTVDYTEVFSDGSKIRTATTINNFSMTDIYGNSLYFEKPSGTSYSTAYNIAQIGKQPVTLLAKDYDSNTIGSPIKTTVEIVSSKELMNRAKVLPLNSSYDLIASYGYSKLYKFTPKTNGVYRIKRTNGHTDQMIIALMYFSTSNDELDTVSGSIFAFHDDINEGGWNMVAGETYYFQIATSDKETIVLEKTANYIPVTSVAMTTSASLGYGETYNLYSKLSYAPSNATHTAISWSSSNSNVATVKNGIVRVCGYGTTVITATIDGKKTTCSVSVPVPKAGSKFVASKATYKITKAGTTGGTVQFVKTASTKKSISIPKTVTSAGITYKVTSVAASALKNNKKVTKLTIGANVSKIGKNAFSGCTKLKTVTIKTKKLKSKSVGKNAFAKVKATVKVPSAKLKTYKAFLYKKGLSKKSKIKK